MEASQKGTAENRFMVAWFIRVAMMGSLGIYILRKPSGGPGPAPAALQSPQDLAARYAKYTTAMIISLALCESVGIYGRLLFFLGDGFQNLYSFMIISAAGMLYYRPNREEIEALSRAY